MGASDRGSGSCTSALPKGDLSTQETLSPHIIPLLSPYVHVMFLRFTGRASTSMIRFGHHRRYSPERNWEPLSDTEWAVLAPFVFRAAEAEMRDAARGRHRGRPAPRRATLPRAPPRRPPRPRPARAPRRHLLARRPHPARPRAPALGRPARALRQARHRLPPVPPLGQAGPLDQAPPGAGRPRPPRHHDPPPPGKLDLPRLSPRLAPARRARHGARPPPRLPFRPARPLLAAARPRFVRTGLFQAPRRHAPRPRARPPCPPERLPAQLQEAAGHRRRPTRPSRAAWRRHERLPARPSPSAQRRPRQRRATARVPAQRRARRTAARSVAPNGGGAFVRSGRPPAPASSPDQPCHHPHLGTSAEPRPPILRRRDGGKGPHEQRLRPRLPHRRQPPSGPPRTRNRGRGAVRRPATAAATRRTPPSTRSSRWACWCRGGWTTSTAAMAICREEGVPVLPRGAGTSQCGQTVNRALVIDCTQAPAAGAVRGRGGTAWRGWSRASPSAR